MFTINKETGLSDVYDEIFMLYLSVIINYAFMLMIM